MSGSFTNMRERPGHFYILFKIGGRVMNKTGKWRKILAIMLTLVMMQKLMPESMARRLRPLHSRFRARLTKEQTAINTKRSRNNNKRSRQSRRSSQPRRKR